MRDDQIRAMILKELAHVDNISLLRYQQNKIRLDSIVSAICEKGCLLKTIFKPWSFFGKVEQIYGVKSAQFNEDMNAALAKEKLKI